MINFARAYVMWPKNPITQAKLINRKIVIHRSKTQGLFHINENDNDKNAFSSPVI